ncbi:MAG: S8 family serine peptidase [Gemmatimonadota bacterium]
MKSYPYVLMAAGLLLSACADADAPITSPRVPGVLDGRSSALSAGQAAPLVPGRVLARFRPVAAASEVAASAGAVLDRPLALGVQVLSVPVGAELRVARALSRNPNVEFAEPDWLRTFGDPEVMPVDDPYIGYKWDLDNDGSLYDSGGNVLVSTGSADADMDWREAVESIGSAGAAARIGIMDSGIRNDHEELAGRIAAQYDFFDGDPDAEDDDGHGSHVAGIAAADANNGRGVAGVAFTGDVEFVIAKVCGPIGRGRFGSYGCPSSAIADGIVWAVDNGAAVLNLSLGGGGGSTTTRSALEYARANDVLPLCAAGNDAGAVSYPGAWPECVAVSATDWSDDLASYSNYGPEVELAAPGGDGENSNGYSYILSAYNDGSSSYVFMAGTSMATPQVTGLGALLHVLGVSDDDAKLSRMKSTADDLGAPGSDDLFGAGRINVAAAVSGLGGGGSNQPPTAAFTYACDDLSCDFDGTGYDPDGSIIAYEWTFGDGATGSAATTSHTYATAGTYSVTLTVTDDDGATGSASQDVKVSEQAGGGFVLMATGYKEKGAHVVDLSWEGATSTDVDVYRDGASIDTTVNEGAYTDATGNHGKGTYVYRVCEAGTSTCSNEVTVTF